MAVGRGVFVTKVDVIEVDACLDESHNLANTVTDHPVEEGFNVSDHSRPNPDVVTLRCFVSNTPLSQQQVQRAIRSGTFDFSTSASQAAQLSVTGIAGRGDDAYRKLYRLRQEGTLVEAVTTLKPYVRSSTGGLIIENLTIPRTRQNYDGLEFSVTLKQIRIVKNRSTTDTRPVEKPPRKKEKKGAVTPEEPDESKLSKTRILGEGQIHVGGG